MSRYFLRISYDGTNYHGWQVQPGSITVQEVVTERIAVMVGDPDLQVVGCGRTDTGVHASSFFLHFDSEGPLDDDFAFRLNAFVPEDIGIHQLYQVGPEAHARFDAIRRTYRYYVHQKKDPFQRHYSWLLKHDLDITQINECCELIMKHNDFACFARSGGANKTTLCKVVECSIEQEGDRLVLTISADRFLRNMVRAVMGTLVEVGRGKLSMQEFGSILENGERSDAGPSAPAHGLFLEKIEYPYLNE